MIAHVRGEVAAVTLNAAVLDVGGVGMKVFCTPATIATLRLGGTAQLATSMVVREDSMTLYGFADNDARDMFELVQTASGVGPKVAQAMLSVLDPDQIRQAIGSADHATLTTVPGIGKKSAERLVLELRDKVGALTTSAPGGGGTAWRSQVLEALQSLGWSAKESEKAIEAVAADIPVGAEPEVSTVLRDALRTLSKT